MFEEVIKYLIDNLEIDIEQKTEFGPVETIEVSVSLGGNVISKSCCMLPQQD